MSVGASAPWTVGIARCGDSYKFCVVASLIMYSVRALIFGFVFFLNNVNINIDTQSTAPVINKNNLSCKKLISKLDTTSENRTEIFMSKLVATLPQQSFVLKMSFTFLILMTHNFAVTIFFGFSQRFKYLNLFSLFITLFALSRSQWQHRLL